MKLIIALIAAIALAIMIGLGRIVWMAIKDMSDITIEYRTQRRRRPLPRQ